MDEKQAEKSAMSSGSTAMTGYADKLWCDLESDAERIEFMKNGRAWKTGIFAKSVIKDLIEVYEFRAKQKA